MLELWLVRHAESEANCGLVSDDVDCALSAAGIRQAEHLRKRMSRERFDAICSSDLKRCSQTASIAIENSPIECDPRLRELVTGPDTQVVDLASGSIDDVVRQLSSPRQKAESGLAFRARVNDWLSALPRSGRVLAFTHTQVVREVLSLVLERDARPMLSSVPNASITRLEMEKGAAKVVAFAALDHLD